MRQIPHPNVADIDLAGVLYALSDPVRLEIVKKLAAAKTMTCQELNQGRPKSSMSHHFQTLRNAGILETQPKGKECFNSLRSSDLEKRFPGLLRSILKSL